MNTSVIKIDNELNPYGFSVAPFAVPNLDAMHGKFYARFSVKNEDDSDSYIRQANRRMELHNDGTYVKELTDWVIMQKIAEENMEGSDSLLCM